MAEENCLCFLCKHAKAATFCCCQGKEVFLCESCVPQHYSKTLGRLHMCIPLSAYGEHNLPGYFDRLQARTIAFPTNCQYLRRNVSLVETCIEEFKQTADQLISELREYKRETLHQLNALKITLERHVDEFIASAEASLTKESPSGLAELAMRLRNVDSEALAFQVFDYCVDKVWLQASKSHTLTYKLLLDSANRDVLYGLCGNSVREYSLSSVSQTGQSTISAKIVDGSCYCQTESSKLLVFAANPPTASAFELDFLHNITTPLPAMTKSRAWAGLFAHGVWVYVFGGDAPELKTCEKFNRATGHWSILPKMNKGRNAFTPCEHRGDLYLPCVRWEHKTLESFSLAREEFTVLQPQLPFTMVDSVALIWAGELVIVAQGLKQMARWRLGSVESFRVSGYFEQNSVALAMSPPVTKGKLCFYVNSKNGDLNIFDLETCLLRRL